MIWRLVFAILALVLTFVAHAADNEDWVLGHWPFEGTLTDVSGKSGDALGEKPEYAEGHQGRALRLTWNAVEIPTTSDLNLAPGLTIDCWVYFDDKPTGYQQIVYKEGEYQLRLDAEQEGGVFSFFVHLGGWEPRIRTIAPQAERWYHLVATWDGTEISLSVNDQVFSTKRVGTPQATDNPVRVGQANCRVDELRLLNPHLLQMREMQSLISSVSEANRSAKGRFGGPEGWAGWQACWGAELRQQDGLLKLSLVGGRGMLLNPALALDADNNAFLSVDLASATVQHATVTFVTDAGTGVVILPVWPVRRTSVINLAGNPNWRGRVRLLGLSFPGAASHTVEVGGLWVADKPEGRPFLYVRNLAPGRAMLRPQREERIIAIVRNLGPASGPVRAHLTVPAGVRVLDGAVKTSDGVDFNGTEQFEWTIRASRPVSGQAKVAVSGEGFASAESTLTLKFTPLPKLPRADYVPPPRPVKPRYLTLMHYCPLWKAGTHYGWERIEDWPDRRPAIGWYDEGTPEVADWHIKYALEHGVQGFIYCWYRSDFSPEIHVTLGHALHDGLLKARYVDMFNFTIMWENGCAKGVQSTNDMMQNVLPYWIKNYFKHPSYVKLDNKPVLFVWRPERVAPEVGGSAAVREMFDKMREACRREGFDGLYIVGCVGSADEGLLKRMAEEGWDASSAYGIDSPSAAPPTMDAEGVWVTDHRATMEGQTRTLEAKKAIGALPDIVDIMMGWDPRPWHGANTQSYRANPSPENFREACLRARALIEKTPGNGLDKRIVVFDNWNEFGEGHYLEPCTGFGFGFLDAIRKVFCDEKQPCVDIVPEDVGIAPPESVYLLRRRILGLDAHKKRQVVDNLLGWWTFDDDNDYLARDSSAAGFDALKDRFEAAEGVVGKGFRCGEGSLTVQPHDLLFPTQGISVELWMRAEMPGQSDRWMVNAVGAANTGYRLGLVGGKIGWQIPQQPWSHMLVSPDAVPVGEWVHVVATHDNRVMQLYVNGRLVGSLDRSGALVPSGNRLCLGAYGVGDTAHAFQGVLDEIRLYDRALTAEEAAAHYAAYRR